MSATLFCYWEYMNFGICPISFIFGPLNSNQNSMKSIIYLITLLLVFPSISLAQGPTISVKTNLLTLPQPQFSGELEISPFPSLGFILGGGTASAIPTIDNLGWFRERPDCRPRDWSIYGGLSIWHPLEDRWDVGGKVLYQYLDFNWDGQACVADLSPIPNTVVVLFRRVHSLNVLPFIRYHATDRVFFEAALGVSLYEVEYTVPNPNGGGPTLDYPAQLNVGFRF